MNPNASLKTAYELFYLECQSRRLTHNTLRFYRGRMVLFLRWCETRGLTSLTDVTHYHLRQYLVDLAESGVSSAYQHRFAKCLKTFFNFCVQDDLLPCSPFEKVKIPKQEKKVLRPLDKEKIHSILKACKHERDKAIFLTFLDTGIRASELCLLNVGDVDMATGEVTIRVGKGQKGRTVYIGPKTRKQIMRYFIKERSNQQQDYEPLFTRQDTGGRMAYDGLKQLVRRIRDETGINFSAHAFRRTFAIESLRKGMNIYVLARLMGHSDISVLRNYLDVTDNDLKDASQQFGVVDDL
jgi:site-specific recombinase XerD